MGPISSLSSMGILRTCPTGELVRVAGCDHIDMFAQHVSAVFGEMGTVDRFLFAPKGRIDPEEIKSQASMRWRLDLTEPQWGRALIMTDPDERMILGYLELRGGRVLSEMHRVSLSMAVLKVHSHAGRGRALLEVAIQWAKKEGFRWLDLNVFQSNERAVNLYRSSGFLEIGRRIDAFCFPSGSVDEIQMSLRL